MTEFRADLDGPAQPLRHTWKTCVGSGYAPLALRADYQQQLARCHRELGIDYVRFHGILHDHIGVVTVQQEETIYSFHNAFVIYDALLAMGVRPFVELSFMPAALASGGSTVFSYAGNITPPRDLDAWAELIRRFVAALRDRYGAEEVRQWFFEVWNEPNLHHFWTGDQDDYFALYRRTVETIKAVDEAFRVGGPATADNAWVDDLVAFCEEEGLPLDFVSTHQYPTDAFGNEGQNTEEKLAAGRRGVMRENVLDVVRQAAGRPVYYTEWNTSSDPFFWRHDTPYAAAFAAKICLDVANHVEGFSYWTFSDIFEENYFSSVPFHGGFGLLTIHGVAKPTYRAFQLLHTLGDERFLVDGLHPTLDCTVTRGDGDVTVFLTNHALPEHPIRDEPVRLLIANSGMPANATVARIDEEHANARRTWEALGSPDYPDADQIGQLHAASEIGRAPLTPTMDGDVLIVEIDVPAHGVAAMTLGGIG